MRKNSKTGRALSGKILLELLAAAFILLGPTVLEGAVGGWGLYAMFILTAAVFVIRLIETGKLHISVNILLCGLCLGYAVPVTFWAAGRYFHIRLIFTALTVTMGAMLTGDYLQLEKDRNIGARLIRMLSVSALLCAAWNIVSWAVLDRFSMEEAFSAGLGNSDLLGLFMLIGLWCSVVTFGRSKSSRGSLFVAGLPMLFVMIMSRSLLTGLFGGLFVLCYFVKKRQKLLCVFFGLVAAGSAVAMILFDAARNMIPFADGLLRGMINPAGLGGGGFVLRQGQYQSVYYEISRLGTGADMSSSLGLAGLLAALGFICWTVYLAFSRRSWHCAFGALLCVFAFIIPLGGSLAAMVLLMGALVYGEWRQECVWTANLKKSRSVVSALLVILAVYSCVLTVGEWSKVSGIKRLTSDPRSAVQKLTTAANLNPLDGESCFLAAQGYRQLYGNEKLRNDIVNAEYYIELAIDREEDCARYYALQACIKADSGDLAAAIELDRRAGELAPLWEDCRIQTAEHLYQLIQTTERGGRQAQIYHQEILELSDEVSDMDKKKIINDYEVKAQPYTRRENFYEEEQE